MAAQRHASCGLRLMQCSIIIAIMGSEPATAAIITVVRKNEEIPSTLAASDMDGELCVDRWSISCVCMHLCSAAHL